LVLGDAKADPRVKVLMTVPGVGPLTALVILAEIGDIRRFGSARKPAASAGLKPTVRGSDRTVRHGHITTQGETRLRWILGEAAQTAQRSPQFAASYQAITRRRGLSRPQTGRITTPRASSQIRMSRPSRAR
jgi:transposase